MAFSSNPYYSVITIDHTKVTGSVTDPVFYMDSLPSDAFAEIHSTGKDIRFSDATGATEYAFDLWQIDTGAETCKINIKLPSYSASVDTELRIWYGDHTLSAYAVTDTYGRNAVYTDYISWYHLEEEASGTGTSGLYVDSAGNFDLDDLTDATGQDGVAGDGQEFDTTNVDYLEDNGIYSTYNAYNKGTIGFWVKPNNNTTSQTCIGFSDGNTNRSQYYRLRYDAGTGLRIQEFVRILGSSFVHRNWYGSTSLSSGTWYHITIGQHGFGVDCTLNGGVETETYLGGSSGAAAWFDDWQTGGTWRVRLGASAVNASSPLDGFLDEVWVANKYLSEDYRHTMYNNQNSPGTFYSVGTKQTAPVTSTFKPIIAWF